MSKASRIPGCTAGALKARREIRAGSALQRYCSLTDGSAHLGLRGYFRRVLSIDTVRVYKPAPSVYQLVLDQWPVTKAEVLFVSSNSFDVIGAASFGFRVCQVNRKQLPLDPLGVEPSLTVAHLGELAELLGVAER